MLLINLIVYSCLAVVFLNAVGNAIDGRHIKSEWVTWASAAVAVLLHPLVVAIASSSGFIQRFSFSQRLHLYHGRYLRHCNFSFLASYWQAGLVDRSDGRPVHA